LRVRPLKQLSSVICNGVNAYKLVESPGELAIDRVGVPLKETLPRAPAGRNDDVGCAFLFDVALCLSGKLGYRFSTGAAVFVACCCLVFAISGEAKTGLVPCDGRLSEGRRG
jgi:hypothetical protein